MEYKLIDEIIARSEAKTWDLAKKEWSFKYIFIHQMYKTCLCGHYPIKNICIIINDKNNIPVEVGNCCVEKFIGLDIGTKIINSIVRLQKDITKSMCIEALNYLNKYKIVSEYEYLFYVDTIRKKKLSDKQQPIRCRINQKLIDYTDINSPLIKIDRILEWAKSNAWFDISFIRSLKDYYFKMGKLSDKQRMIIDKIAQKYKL